MSAVPPSQEANGTGAAGTAARASLATNRVSANMGRAYRRFVDHPNRHPRHDPRADMAGKRGEVVTLPLERIDPRPHTPQRPLWLCRVCAEPWPCGIARLRLAAEYKGDRVGLAVYLCAQLHDAAADLYRLHPSDPPSPPALFARFFAWARLG